MDGDDNPSIEPLDTGQRNRRKNRKRLIRKWMRRMLRNRNFLLAAFWVVKAIVKLVQTIIKLFDGS